MKKPFNWKKNILTAKYEKAFYSQSCRIALCSMFNVIFSLDKLVDLVNLRQPWAILESQKCPHALSARKQKELFESSHPFPTRQLPICAEQLKDSPATRIYEKEKIQAWLTHWCPPPFGAWDALPVAKASFVGLGPFGRHICTGPHSPF